MDTTAELQYALNTIWFVLAGALVWLALAARALYSGRTPGEPPFVHTTLFPVRDLAGRLDDPAIVVVDCRFDLMRPAEGRESYLEGHVPGAVYAHLDEDLSGPPLTDHGRHPLPGPEALRALFSRLGVDSGVQVVAYDQADGSVASRLWWLLRYMGHDAVAVLDGGWKAWQEAALPVRSGEEHRSPVRFTGEPRAGWLVTARDVPGVSRLLDARSGGRYRGESEPLDPVAGHIPGARHHFYRRSVGDDGRFLAPDRIRADLEATLAGTPLHETAVYCGSGVTACHVLLAAAHAGLGDGRLYAGSWSDWITDASRPVALGPEPGSAPGDRG